MLNEHELQAISQALTRLQHQIGSTFDGLKGEIDEIKKEINQLKYNVEKNHTGQWQLQTKFKDIELRLEKLENLNDN